MASITFTSSSFTGQFLFAKWPTSSHNACPFRVSMTVRGLSRREILRSGLCLAAASSLSRYARPGIAIAEESSEFQFSASPLPYAYDALEPAIDSATMAVHHDKLFVAYAAKLNAALAKLGRNMPTTDEALMELLSKLRRVKDESLRSALRNQGGGYLNHKQFFESMAPKTSTDPSGKIIDKISSQFGSMENFKKEFIAQATSLFGSGFVYLVQEKSGNLAIRQYRNQDHPCMDNNGNTALLGCDCWEHAYFCKYANRRAEYLMSWYDVISWDKVNERFENKLV